MTYRSAALLACLAGAGCTTLQPGASLKSAGGPDVSEIPRSSDTQDAGSQGNTPRVTLPAGLLADLGAAVEFDHGCPPEKVRLIRTDRATSIDLDVCGVVRRYKRLGAHLGAWLDVTVLYPATSIPPPLPAVSGHGKPSAGDAGPRAQSRETHVLGSP